LKKDKSVIRASNVHMDKPDFTYITSGRITLASKSPLHLRLRTLHETLIDIIRQYNPHEMVVERMFFAKSVRAALSLGHARGIALLAAASEGLDFYEYSALEVKKAVTGYGRADKKQVLEMVKRMLKFNAHVITLTEDSADALALALCHLNTKGFKKTVRNVQ
jgi:crossover junction endodeoxyribonuclease RuvC